MKSKTINEKHHHFTRQKFPTTTQIHRINISNDFIEFPIDVSHEIGNLLHSMATNYDNYSAKNLEYYEVVMVMKNIQEKRLYTLHRVQKR